MEFLLVVHTLHKQLHITLSLMKSDPFYFCTLCTLSGHSGNLFRHKTPVHLQKKQIPDYILCKPRFYQYTYNSLASTVFDNILHYNDAIGKLYLLHHYITYIPIFQQEFFSTSKASVDTVLPLPNHQLISLQQVYHPDK